MSADKRVLLTIAIPTYNRAEILEKIINQLGKEKERSFLILISDDNSSDNTEAIVKKYQEHLPNLIYHKNETNLGYSGNVCKLYELASTRYIWFLCDDDTVLPGAVTKILQAIEKYKPTIALFNCIWIDPFGRKLLAGVKHDIIHQNINQLSNYQVLTRLTYLSILVVKKRISIKRLKQTDYKDNVFFQVSLSLLLLSNKFKLCELASSIVHRNVGYKYGEFFKFSIVDFLKAIYVTPFKFKSKRIVIKSRQILLTNLQLYLSQKIGLFKYEGNTTTKTKKLIFQYYGFIYGIIFMSFPIIKLIIPTILIKLLYLIKLISIHGYQNGLLIYNKNINRAFTDNRKTGFVNYR